MNFWEHNSYNTQNDVNNENKTAESCNIDKDVKEKFDRYSSKSEDQLMSELSATVARMKKDGSFDAAAMENLYNTAAPFLNEEQKQRMRSIIDMFKG